HIERLHTPRPSRSRRGDRHRKGPGSGGGPRRSCDAYRRCAKGADRVQARGRVRSDEACRIGEGQGRSLLDKMRFRDATKDDVAIIAALQNAVAGALTARFGAGHWSSLVTERGAALSLRHSRVRVGRSGKRILTTLRLAKKKPWAIDRC